MSAKEESNGLPEFKTIDLIMFQLTLNSTLKRHLQTIDNILLENTRFNWNNLMQPLEDMDDELERLWSPLAHLHAVVDSDPLRNCYEACLSKLSAYESAIGHNQRLYEAIKSIDLSALNKTQQKIIHDSLLDFELSGVNLLPDEKKRFEHIQARLAELSNQFENNVLDATLDFSLHIDEPEKLNGLPEHSIQRAQNLAQEKGLSGYLLNLEYPCYHAIITHAEDRQLRETFYHAYVTRASEIGPSAGCYDNNPVVDEILNLRYEKARILGFSNYAEYSIATKMAESTEQVLEFLHDLTTRAYRQALLEYDRLQTFARKNCNIDSIKPWDIAFITEKKQNHLFNLTQESLRSWFPLNKVMDGLFAIVHRLYGMHFEAIDNNDVWHPDVRCYQVYDNENTLRGTIYTDLFSRGNKRGGAWMDSLQSRIKRSDGSVQMPIATLNCNFTNPSKNKEAYLSHDEVLTLFHEFGHCLHHVLTKVDYISASGINGVEWDAVEFPSQFFENWCWNESALELLTEHETTKEPLPYEIYERLLASKNFLSAMALIRQLEFSTFDFRLHCEFQPGVPKQMEAILEEVRKVTSVTPRAEYNRFPLSFSHIFGGGYAAGYYSYKWAEVLSSDAFARFEEEGIFNQHTGRDFLHFILETGGSRKATETYIGFRGRIATVDALLKHSGIK